MERKRGTFRSFAKKEGSSRDADFVLLGERTNEESENPNNFYRIKQQSLASRVRHKTNPVATITRVFPMISSKD